MSIASRWAAWDRRMAGTRAGPLGGTDPVTGTWSPRVELFLDEAWVDITRTSPDEAGVYYRDAITITRGRSDEAAHADPSTCAFTLNNRDGRFSPRNPLSPYYGQLTRNTPVRVSVLQNGIRRYRFYGEISSWPVTWDISGEDVYVKVVASGIKRRLQQGSAPLKSAVYRDMTSPMRTAIVAYWPLEDGAASTTLAAGLDGVEPMRMTQGAADFAAYSDWFGSDPIVTMQTALFKAVLPRYTDTGEISVRCFCKVISAVSSTYQNLLRVHTTGTASSWQINLKNDGSLRVIAKSSDEATTHLDSGDIAFAMNTAGLRMITLELSTSGSNVAWNIITTDFSNSMTVDDDFTLLNTSGTISSQTLGRVYRMTVASNAGLGDVAIGHLSVANDLGAYADSARSLVSWNDEEPAARFARLCTEEGINGVTVTDDGTQGNDVSMGNQRSDTLNTLLEACEDTDMGLLYEQRDASGFTYRTRLGLYNQDTRLALDYSAHELADALNPVDDDQKIANDITVTRQDGSSFRQVLETGALSVNDPPNGVGRYDTAVTVSLGSDDQLVNQAGWRLHLGTVDEARYPQIALNLRHPSFADDVDLMNAAMVLDIGDRVTIDNPPAWLPPDQISLIVQGYTETFDQLEYTMSVNCSPESPYHIAVYGTDRYDTGGSELASAATSSATSLSVSTTSGPLWTTDAGDVPFDITVGGERITVTAVSGSSSPQTFTVTRSVNGIVKSHAAGTAVSLYSPTYRAL